MAKKQPHLHETWQEVFNRLKKELGRQPTMTELKAAYNKPPKPDYD